MSRKRAPTTQTLSDEKVYRFPGVWGLDTEPDRWLRELREGFREFDTRSSKFVRFRDGTELAEYGLVPSDIPLMDYGAVPSTALDHPLAEYYDRRSLVQIDYRVRWCRCLLSTFSLPYDREPIVFIESAPEVAAAPKIGEVEPGWRYVSDVPDLGADVERHDPLDWLLESTFFTHSHVWYAAKILAHHNRAEWLINKSNGKLTTDVQFGLMRECMLFGETWAQARFLVNHGKPAVARRKQLKKFAKENPGRARRNATRIREAQDWRSQALSIASESTLTGMARARWVQTQLRRRHRVERAVKTIQEVLRGGLDP